MAGFFKNIFSFGKKEVVEERIDETAPLPPIKWDALEALKPAAEQVVPEFLKREEPEPPTPHPPLDGEGRHEVAGRGESADAGATHPHPQASLGTSPIEGEVKPAPQSAPEEPKPKPAPTIPPAPEPVVPSEPEPLPEPAPVEEPQPEPEIPEPPAPEEVPAPPAVPEPAPEPQPQEVPPAPAEPEIEPSRPEPQLEPAPVEAPTPAETPAEPAAPIEVPQPSAPPAQPTSEVSAAPHPPAGTFSPYSHGEKDEAPHPPLGGEGRREAAGGGDGADASANHPHPQASLGTSPIKGEVKRTSVEAVPAPVEAKTIVAELAPAPAPQPSPQSKPAPGKVTVTKKVEQKAEPQKAPEPAPRRSWFQRMRDGLARSSKELTGNIAGVFTKRKLDEETLQDLEDVLIRADLGMETALRVTDALAASRYGKDVSDADVRTIMAAEVEKVLAHVAMPLELDLSHKPHVILVVGVNGTGKTTTIGKLAAKLTDGGLSVMLAAGDTFRAAAIEQLKIWGERTKSPVIASKIGADAAGLAYDAFERAKEAGSDVLIIDTAGRLQNKTELMAELEKIVRVLGKLDPEAPHTVLQTVDATTGQNALNQVEIFRNVAGVNGLVMTKLDGTARGGILVAIAAKHKLPVYFIGVGEQVDDLEPFSAGEFARAIAGVA
ncbi:MULTISPECIES: signal recognition particle-docking protein FtsY [unclassified Mesorhizobium]|uniref:signal recognition particle-docking protein FtsY n=1 Tax=unclassified Mesorhizobium TaxID=325217 RepID=UPI0003CDEAD6|nr:MULTISPECIES: signal recognition particle-docking protein FtsY [unclassified Mesorhizobium]ESX23606.1 cell division protein FtsY [Mesorhizobium sp. LSHC440B00]ESX34183.1 cell division protein FtsY [Mesorhizobium sp. LSHC432A00]ESX35791.1 cell division protein FtsY [Mesorhizobium sp. LSHC440A00]WJI58350.1 signal recognition particle-docking protein FtsY [Mesorhizobium sp. C432A]